MSIVWGKMLEDPSAAPLAAAAGYSRVQVTVDSIMNLGPDDFTRQKELFRQCRVVPEVCSSPLPPDVQVTERGFNIYVWTEYLKKASRRMAELGCHKLAWNNGRARVLPWEGDIVGVKEQVLQFLYLLCEVAGEHGITVLVEPLGPLRTNFLNTMAEVSDFLARIGKENLASMISLRETDEIGLGIEEMALFPELIKHVQLENPRQQKGKRIAPHPQDGIDYRPFLNQLRQMDYSGMICLPSDADQASLAYCRSLWESLP